MIPARIGAEKVLLVLEQNWPVLVPAFCL